MKPLLYVGQWQGFYTYGPEYGDMEGGEAEFRLFIEHYKDGRFTGRAIDWDGVGANGEVSQVEGFVEGHFISLTKQYPTFYAFDDLGNTVEDASAPGHKVVYEGRFHPEQNAFSGTWEIAVEVEQTEEVTIEEVVTGTWRMQGHD